MRIQRLPNGKFAPGVILTGKEIKWFIDIGIVDFSNVTVTGEVPNISLKKNQLLIFENADLSQASFANFNTYEKIADEGLKKAKLNNTQIRQLIAGGNKTQKKLAYDNASLDVTPLLHVVKITQEKVDNSEIEIINFENEKNDIFALIKKIVTTLANKKTLAFQDEKPTKKPVSLQVVLNELLRKKDNSRKLKAALTDLITFCTWIDISGGIDNITAEKINNAGGVPTEQPKLFFAFFNKKPMRVGPLSHINENYLNEFKIALKKESTASVSGITDDQSERARRSPSPCA